MSKLFLPLRRRDALAALLSLMVLPPRRAAAWHDIGDLNCNVIILMPRLTEFTAALVDQFKAQAAPVGAKHDGTIHVQEIYAKDEPAEQIAQVVDVVTKGGTDGLLIFPVDGNALAEAVEKAKADGVAVMALIDPIPGVPTVWTDPAAVGALQAQWIIDRVPGGRVLDLTGPMSDRFAAQREQGFVTTMKDRGSQFAVTTAGGADFGRETAKTLTIQSLNSDTPNVIAAAWDLMALGALDAIKERGPIIRPKIISYGGLEPVRAAIAAGEIDATVADNLAEIALTALEDHILMRSGQQDFGSQSISVPPNLIEL